MIPILALVAIALVAGVLIGRATNDSDSSEAGTTPSATQQPPGSVDSSAGSASQAAADAGVKAAVITGAQAMETCATDNSGQYSSCDADALVKIDPTLAEHEDALTVGSTTTTYTIELDSPTGNRFKLERLETGTTDRTCTESGVAGCQSGGTW